jgi:hypothetical protein
MEHSDPVQDLTITENGRTRYGTSAYQRDWDTESLFIPIIRMTSNDDAWKEGYDVYL